MQVSEPPAPALERTLDEIILGVRRLMAIDAAAFLVIDWEREQITPAASWFATDEVRAAVWPLLSRRYDRERPGITEGAIEQNRPLLLPRVGTWSGAALLRERLGSDLDREQAERTWSWYERASVISAPVRTSEGRTLGVLAIGASPTLPALDEESLRLVEVFADLAALAIDRAQLLEAEERRSRQELVLNEAGRTIAESLDPGVVYRRIVEQTAVITGASKVLLARYLAPLEQLEVAAAVGFAHQHVGTRYGLGDGMLGRVARTREPYRSRPEDRGRFLRRVVDAEGIRSFMHVPIELGPRLFGVLNASSEREDAFGEAELEQLLKLARLAAAAIANAADYQHELHLARALARGFVPAEPGVLPGVELGVRYEPAERAPTGGDLYGAWEAPGGAVAILIGDASGRGLEVAGLAAMVRFFVDARSLDSTCPAEVLRQTNALLRDRLPVDSFVTAFFGFVEGDELRYCNAGHAAPLVVAAAGAPRPLAGTGLPLGIEDDPQLEAAAHALAPGDLLFAFTDGLAEARRHGEQFGEAELLAAAVGARGAEPQAFVDAVYEHASGWAGSLDDDVALLALRRRA